MSIWQVVEDEGDSKQKIVNLSVSLTAYGMFACVVQIRIKAIPRILKQQPRTVKEKRIDEDKSLNRC